MSTLPRAPSCHHVPGGHGDQGALPEQISHGVAASPGWEEGPALNEGQTDNGPEGDRVHADPSLGAT